MSNSKLTRICPNGIIQQGEDLIPELSVDLSEFRITLLRLISKPDIKLPIIRFHLSSGEYYFAKYQDLALFEKDYQELKQIRDGN